MNVNVSSGMDRRSIIRGVVSTLLINGVAPFVVYEVLLGHMSNLTALSIATCIPLLDNVRSFVKDRRLDVFAVFMLLGFVLSIVVLFFGGSEKLLLIRESFVTAILGIIFLGSLLFGKPLIYHFALRFTVGNEPSHKAAFASNWEYPYFRFVNRLLTLVWGAALVGEAIVRSILVFNLTVSQFLAISNFVLYGFIGAAILITVYYRRYAKTRLDAIRQGAAA